MKKYFGLFFQEIIISHELRTICFSPTRVSRAGEKRVLRQIEFLSVISMDPKKIINCIKAGDINNLKKYVGMGLDVNSTFKYYESLVSEASLANQEQIVRFLIENGANIESQSVGGTPLQCALRNNNMSLAKYLYEKGADVNTSTYGIKSLTQVVRRGDLDGVKFLLENGANPTTSDARYTEPSLLCASKNGFAEIVELLLKYKVKKYVSRNEDSLAAACRYNHIKVVKILLDKGKFKLHQKNYKLEGDRYHSPLEESCINGNIECAKLLLKAGADPDFTLGNQRDTPILLAVKEGYLEIVKLLHKHGASIEFKNREEETNYYLSKRPNPLGVACYEGHFEIVKYLVDNGANPNTGVTFNGDYTPMDNAKSQGHLKIVEYLKSS